ncbi:hypothetical protein DTO164E3_6506 [Paecilomyces variotii]|nr:hypothetical protein DTO164E3_6506 [Paecilomyces variotii]KAJ9222847.1 hypothetical protein DTO169C6_4862 [Paecilomyces variotii]KAJ9352352.1 hypothetical protein DTO027B9_5827 [Paecilomyces variotii]KAJ9406232.1 hypothetical protein DTO045G8_6112 [Paecilomyces variotii]
MPPKRKATQQKRKAPPETSETPETPETPQPTRKSARIIDNRQPLAGPSARAMSVQSGLSTLSTEVEPPETWPDLCRQAKEQIDRYEAAVDSPKDKGKAKAKGKGREKRADKKLKACMTALLDWLPPGGRDSAARDILQCETDDKLYEMFENIRTCLLAPLKMAGSNSASRTPIEKREENVEIVASTLGNPQQREEQFRKDLLRRDNHRCVITQDLHWEKWEEIGAPEDLDCDYIEAAHIIPFSLASWKAEPGSTYDISQVWEALYRCFPAVRRVIGTKNINDRSNGLCLREDIHRAFGSFGIAFEPTNTPDVYNLKSYRRARATRVRRTIAKVGQVTLQAADGAGDVPMPNPVLLDCHWRVAEILNASGMGEEIDEYMRELEAVKMSMGDGSLNEDGSSDLSRYLDAAFWGRSDRAVSC